MSSPANIIFNIVDISNAPVNGLTLSFTTYEDISGDALTQPTITGIGGGAYKFLLTFPSSATGIAYTINVPSGYAPAILTDYTRPLDWDLDDTSPHSIVFSIFDGLTPKTGLSLSFSTYQDNDGTTLTPVSIIEVGGGFYKFTPVFPSTSVGINYEINTGYNPIIVSGYVRPEDFMAGGIPIPVSPLPSANPNIFANIAPINYGQDTYDLDDLPVIDTQVIGTQNLGLRLARRLTTPYGALAIINDDPDFGYDIYQLLNTKYDQQIISAAISDIEAECLKEEEVQFANVSINVDQNVITIIVNITPSINEPFTLVLNIGDVTYNKLVINEAQ